MWLKRGLLLALVVGAALIVFKVADLAVADRGAADLRTVHGPPAGGVEQVMLLHGLGRGAGSMETLERELTVAGYEVRNFDYPSTEQPPDQLMALLAREIAACCSDPSKPLHFVTHSLGGILVRAYLEVDRPTNLGRVVMLAPPNGGSEVVDTLGESWLFAKVLGPTAVELGTDPESLPNRIGPPSYPLGILASNQSINPIGSWLLPGDDDGAVKVAATRLEGMSDFRVIAATHTFIMNDAAAIRETLYFLRYGKFAPLEEADHPTPGEYSPEDRPTEP